MPWSLWRIRPLGLFDCDNRAVSSVSLASVLVIILLVLVATMLRSEEIEYTTVVLELAIPTLDVGEISTPNLILLFTFKSLR